MLNGRIASPRAHLGSRVVLLAAVLVACRGRAPSAQTVSDQQLALLVDSLMPGVSKATGLEFKTVPKSAVRTRDQIHTYLIAKMARELPPARLEGIADSYRLLGMVPDSIDFGKLFLALYTEQIAGFYDPDSTTLFAVQGGNPAELRLVLAHELVHALQDQYLPLDSILRDASDGDRQSAAQAILEGQATVASLRAIMPGIDLEQSDAFWSTFRNQLRTARADTGVFGTAPMVIRESLIFPYLAGGEFIRWFDRTYPGKEPYRSAMPRSTEQLLHPERYVAHDEPVRVRFDGDTSGVIFDDTFGEFDVDLLRAVVHRDTVLSTDPAQDWGGDRMRIYRTANGPAMVWMTTWDSPAGADRFDQLVAHVAASAGDRLDHRKIVLDGHPAVEVVIAPTRWPRWGSLPTARVAP